MKNLIVFLLTMLIMVSCKGKKEKVTQVKESVAEVNIAEPEQGVWTVLFDGTSFEGWHGYLKESVPSEWKIEEGAMVFYPPEKRPKGVSYNIVTNKEYTDFVLSIEWKISKGGNSGVFWGVKEDPELSEAYETGPEIQVLDNENHPDAKNGTSHQAGALYDMVSPSKDATKPVGEWNVYVITVNHKTNKGQVLLNGEEVVSFSVNNPDWSAMVSKSKFADWEAFGNYTTGKIGLQDHGDIVAYRNIKIKEL
ncbi:MAG: DUF1080 domain-containing protein [Cellulophaga sp.]